MKINDDLLKAAVTNTGFVNLDLDEEERRAAIQETARHLDALATMAPLSPAAANVMRVISYMPHGNGNIHGWYRAMAEALRTKVKTGD